MSAKNYVDKTVLDATLDRLQYVFTEFEKIYMNV